MAQESKSDLKNIRRNFEDQLTNQERNRQKRDKKRNTKANEKQGKEDRRAKKGESAFVSDFEAGKKPKYSKLNEDGSPSKSEEKPKYFKKKKQLKKK